MSRRRLSTMDPRTQRKIVSLVLVVVILVAIVGALAQAL